MVLKFCKQRLRQHRLRRAKVIDDVPHKAEKIADWALWPDAIHSGSVIYSFGVGDNVAWDLAMIQRFGAQVHAFDPTPRSIDWVARQTLPIQFHFFPFGLSNFDGLLDFYPPRKTAGTHYSQQPRGFRASCGPPVQGQVFRLATIMNRLGHTRLDVLKMDIEGSEFEAVPDLIHAGICVDQLLVEIHYHFPSRSFQQGVALIGQLKAYGMDCIYISDRGLEFAFVRQGLGK